MTWFINAVDGRPALIGEPAHTERFSDELLASAMGNMTDEVGLHLDGDRFQVNCDDARLVYHIYMRETGWRYGRLVEWTDRHEVTTLDEPQPHHIDGLLRFKATL